MINKLQHLSASQAAKLLGVSSETLRRWEQAGELGFEVPQTDGGHRRYPKEDVLRLKRQLTGEDKYLIEKVVEKPRESEEIAPGLFRHFFNDGTGESVVSGGPLLNNNFDDNNLWDDEYNEDNYFSDHEVVKYMQSLKGSKKLSLISIIGKDDMTLRKAHSKNCGTGFVFDSCVLAGKFAGGQASGGFWPSYKNTYKQYGLKKEDIENLSEDQLQDLFLNMCADYSFIAKVDVNRNGWLNVTDIIEMIPNRIDIPEGHLWFKRDPNEKTSGGFWI